MSDHLTWCEFKWGRLYVELGWRGGRWFSTHKLSDERGWDAGTDYRYTRVGPIFTSWRLP